MVGFEQSWGESWGNGGPMHWGNPQLGGGDGEKIFSDYINDAKIRYSTLSNCSSDEKLEGKCSYTFNNREWIKEKRVDFMYFFLKIYEP